MRCRPIATLSGCVDDAHRAIVSVDVHELVLIQPPGHAPYNYGIDSGANLTVPLLGIKIGVESKKKMMSLVGPSADERRPLARGPQPAVHRAAFRPDSDEWFRQVQLMIE